MDRVRAVVVGAVVAGLLHLSLDSGMLQPVPAPPLTSVALGGLALLFGLGAWATAVGGQRERSPYLAGIALGTGGYALVRLL